MTKHQERIAGQKFKRGGGESSNYCTLGLVLQIIFAGSIMALLVLPSRTMPLI